MTSIVLAADEQYLPYVVCTLSQLARFGRGADGVTLLVPATAALDGLADLAAAATLHGVALDVVPVSELAPMRASGLLIDSEHISYFTYVKLLLAERLPRLDDVLYLDIDTLIRAPLDPLLSWELRHPLAAVEELGRNSRRMFGTSRDAYFNAGVLRMSLSRMRRERVWEQAQEILATQRGLRFQDQDVLNLIFRSRFDILPCTYNMFDSLSLVNRDLWNMRDPALVHFAGPIKPWHRAAESGFAREWRRQYSQALRASAYSGPPTIDSDAAVQRPSPRNGGASGLARRMIPTPVRRAARSALRRVLDRIIGRLEEAKTALELGSDWRSNLKILASPRAAESGSFPNSSQSQSDGQGTTQGGMGSAEDEI